MSYALLVYGAIVLNVVLIMAVSAWQKRGPWVCAKCGEPCRNSNPMMHQTTEAFFRCGHANPERPKLPEAYYPY